MKNGDFVEDIIFVKIGRLALDLPILIEDEDDEEVKLPYSRSLRFNQRKNSIQYCPSVKFNRKNSLFNCITRSKTLKRNSIVNIKLPSIKNFDKKLNFLNGNDNENENGSEEEKKEDKFQYYRILEIQKNEHFGDILMFLNKRSPLRVKVKSRKAELFYLKKNDAIEISVSFPQIWKKINKKSLFNWEQIKILMGKVLKIFGQYEGIEDEIEQNEDLEASFIENIDLQSIPSSIEKTVAEEDGGTQIKPINENVYRNRNTLQTIQETNTLEFIDRYPTRNSINDKGFDYKNNKYSISIINESHSNHNLSMSNNDFSNNDFSNNYTNNKDISNKNISNNEFSSNFLNTKDMNNKNNSNEFSNSYLSNKDLSNKNISNNYLNTKDISNKNISNNDFSNSYLSNKNNSNEFSNSNLSNKDINKNNINNNNLSNNDNNYNNNYLPLQTLKVNPTFNSSIKETAKIDDKNNRSQVDFSDSSRDSSDLINNMRLSVTPYKPEEINNEIYPNEKYIPISQTNHNKNKDFITLNSSKFKGSGNLSVCSTEISLFIESEYENINIITNYKYSKNKIMQKKFKNILLNLDIHDGALRSSILTTKSIKKVSTNTVRFMDSDKDLKKSIYGTPKMKAKKLPSLKNITRKNIADIDDELFLPGKKKNKKKNLLNVINKNIERNYMNLNDPKLFYAEFFQKYFENNIKQDLEPYIDSNDDIVKIFEESIGDSHKCSLKKFKDIIKKI